MNVKAVASGIALLGVFLTLAGSAETPQPETVPLPSGPPAISLHAPEAVVPGFSIPIYLLVKAGASELKEISWNLYCCGGVTEGGAYYVQAGEEREVAGKFSLDTSPVIRHGPPFFASGIVLNLRIWALDRAGKRSEVRKFDVTLDPGAPKAFPPPKDGPPYAKEMGVITGNIHRPIIR